MIHINNRIFVNVQTHFRYKWNPRRRFHMATTLLHKRASSYRPKLPTGAIVKVSQISQGGDVNQLRRSDKLPSGEFRHKLLYRRNERQNPKIHTSIKYDADELRRVSVEKALRCDLLYDEYVLKRIFTKGLHRSINHSMRSYRRSRKFPAVHDLARHATSLTCSTGCDQRRALIVPTHQAVAKETRVT